MKVAPSETDFVVIGAGIAGLRAAIELAPAGRVIVLSKEEAPAAKLSAMEERAAAALSDEDEVSLHLQDTLQAGDGLTDPEAAKLLSEEAPERIEEVIRWSAEFNRRATKLSFAREGTHGRERILHAQGESTGREIAHALQAKARSLPNISFFELEFVTDLCSDAGRICGVELAGGRRIGACAVLLATGGAGQLYSNTTNRAADTADGCAIARRASAEIRDMEFMQFHPTVLYAKKAPRVLLSESLRAEGAYLRNDQMSRFMRKYHPMAEMAPQEMVARAIMHELEVSRSKDPCAYLDLTHLDEARIKSHFPRAYAICLQYNVDITSELIPIRPAAHYAMGGVRTGLNGRASMPGLYAAGEAASSGLHGANRLPGNSLLEGLVFGARAGIAMREELRPAKRSAGEPARAEYSNGPVDGEAEAVIREIQELMWRHAGIVRTGSGLRQAIARLQELAPRVSRPYTRRSWEARNLCETALLTARSALGREESRGAHYRSDFPARNDAKFLKHSIAQGESIRLA